MIMMIVCKLFIVQSMTLRYCSTPPVFLIPKAVLFHSLVCFFLLLLLLPFKKKKAFFIVASGMRRRNKNGSERKAESSALAT